MVAMRGMFGRRPDWMTPGIGDGLPNSSMPQDMTVSYGRNLGANEPRPKSGGFFGKGGVGRGIAGTIGDVLLQQGGVAPIYGPQMQMQQMMAFRQAEEQRRRAAELADFRTQMQIRQEFQPTEKDAFDRALAAANIDPESEQGVALYRQRAMTLAQGQPQEPRMVTLPDGRAVFGTMDEIRGILSGSQASGPQVLGQSLPEGWQIEGGAGGNASGSFR